MFSWKQSEVHCGTQVCELRPESAVAAHQRGLALSSLGDDHLAAESYKVRHGKFAFRKMQTLPRPRDHMHISRGWSKKALCCCRLQSH